MSNNDIETFANITHNGLSRYHYERKYYTETVTFYAEGRVPFKVCIVPESLSHGSLHCHLAEIDIKTRFWHGFTERDVVLDAGHGFGAYTLPPAALGAEVWGIDPEGMESMHVGFKLSCEANEWFGGRLHIRQAWLGGKADPVPHAGENSTGICETITIDSLERPFTWINLDTEGAELDILRGAERVLRENKPRILLENHLFLDKDCERNHDTFLAERGYKKMASIVEGACTHSFYVHPEGR